VILCAGHAAYDINFLLDEFPQENRKYHVDEVAESSGGPAANAASLLARWGVTTALIAPLGLDPYAQAIRRDLEADGVITGLLQGEATYPTPFSVIVAHASRGSRTILTRKPLRPRSRFDEGDLKRIAPVVEGLLFDGHEPELSLELLAAYPRAWSLLDAGTLRTGTERLAGHVDYLVASESFTATLAARRGLGGPDSGLEALQTLSPRWVAFTEGERGCRWLDPERRLKGSVPALPVDALDTTGAGDIFHGAFAYALVQGCDPVEALRWGSVAAGLSVTARGGRSSIPSREAVADLVARGSCLPSLSVVG